MRALHYSDCFLSATFLQICKLIGFSLLRMDFCREGALILDFVEYPVFKYTAKSKREL